MKNILNYYIGLYKNTLNMWDHGNTESSLPLCHPTSLSMSDTVFCLTHRVLRKGNVVIDFSYADVRFSLFLVKQLEGSQHPLSRLLPFLFHIRLASKSKCIGTFKNRSKMLLGVTLSFLKYEKVINGIYVLNKSILHAFLLL